MNKEWQDALNKVIKEQDMYGWSFTNGYALKHIMKTKQYLSEDMENQLYSYLEDGWFNHIARALEQAGRRDINLRAWAELLDIAELDELARDLEGENNE